ncbi:MAG: hypothetical protein RQM90_14375 [Methanoculleus sp.]|jgi:hypothetical protein
MSLKIKRSILCPELINGRIWGDFENSIMINGAFTAQFPVYRVLVGGTGREAPPPSRMGDFEIASTPKSLTSRSMKIK